MCKCTGTPMYVYNALIAQTQDYTCQEMYKSVALHSEEEEGTMDHRHRVSREYQVVEIRRENRQDIFRKRRALQETATEIQQGQVRILEDESSELVLRQIVTQLYSLDLRSIDTEYLIENILKPEPAWQMYGLVGLMQRTSEAGRLQHISIASSLVESKVLARLIGFLEMEQSVFIRREALLVLTNVACSLTEHSECLVQAQIVSKLFKVIAHDRAQNAMYSCQCLSNIVLDSDSSRDTALNHGALQLLKTRYKSTSGVRQSQQIIGTMAILCRGFKIPSYDKVKEAVCLIVQVLASGTIEDRDIVYECLCAAAYFSHPEDHKKVYKTIIESNLIDYLLVWLDEHLKADQRLMVGLRLLGNVALGGEEECRMVVRKGGLARLELALRSKHHGHRTEAAWALSNLAACPDLNVARSILKEGCLSQQLVALIHSEGEDERTRKECCYVFCNIAMFQTDNCYMEGFLKLSILEPMLTLLDSQSDIVVSGILSCLHILLSKADEQSTRVIFNTIKRLDYEEKLEDLCLSPHKKVQELSYTLIQAYFQQVDPLLEIDRMHQLRSLSDSEVTQLCSGAVDSLQKAMMQ